MGVGPRQRAGRRRVLLAHWAPGWLLLVWGVRCVGRWVVVGAVKAVSVERHCRRAEPVSHVRVVLLPSVVGHCLVLGLPWQAVHSMRVL